MQDITNYKVYNASKPVPQNHTRLWYNDGISCGSGWYDIPNQYLQEAANYFWEDPDEPRCTAYFDMECTFST